MQALINKRVSEEGTNTMTNGNARSRGQLEPKVGMTSTE